MNKARRAKIDQALSYIDSARSLLNEVMEEEQDAFDNLPEGLQATDKGATMEEAVSELESATEALEETQEMLDTIPTETPPNEATTNTLSEAIDYLERADDASGNAKS